MNIDDIEKSLRLTRKWAEDEDDERAHTEQDELFYAFVDSIAKDTFEGEVSEGAKKVMSSLSIEFSRWHV